MADPRHRFHPSAHARKKKKKKKKPPFQEPTAYLPTLPRRKRDIEGRRRRRDVLGHAGEERVGRLARGEPEVPPPHDLARDEADLHQGQLLAGAAEGACSVYYPTRAGRGGGSR